MSSADIVGILQVGFSGFAFLLSGYSFRLLYLEGRREGDPRPPLLAAIRQYANYTLVVALLVAGSKLADSALTSWNHRQEGEMLRLSRDAETCRDSLAILARFDRKTFPDYTALSELAHNTAPSCTAILRALSEGH